MKELAFGLTLSAIVYTCIYIWITTPVVQVSHSSGECVQVLPQGSCDDLPRRYYEEIVR